MSSENASGAIGGPGSFVSAAPVEGAARDAEPAGAASRETVETLSPHEVFQGDSDDVLGAWLTFETVGESTVVQMATGEAGGAALTPIATLEDVSGVTLKQLLNDYPFGT